MINLLASTRTGQRVAQHGGSHPCTRAASLATHPPLPAAAGSAASRPFRAMPPRPRRARNGLRTLCQNRPERASQPIYTAVRLVVPQLRTNPSPQARLEAMRLTHTLETYVNAERRLRGELSKPKELATCVEAAESATLLLATVKVAETYPSVPNLRPLKRALSERIEELQIMANRARLELILRA